MGELVQASQGANALESILEACGKSLKVGLGVLGTLGTYHILKVLWYRRTMPPGPFPWPLIGNFNILMPLPHRSLQKLHAKYGPLITVWYGSKVTVVVGSPDVVKQTHRDQGNKMVHRTLTEFAKLSLHADEEGGKNVALAGGKYWIKTRRIFVQELMSKKFITNQCCPKISEEIWSTIEAIKDNGDKPFDPHTYLQRLSLNIVFRLTYGLRFGRNEMGVDNSKLEKLLGIINTIMKVGGQNVASNYIPLLKLFQRGQKERNLTTVTTRDNMLLELLAEHRETIDHAKPRDFLDVLITRQATEDLSDIELSLIAWEFITAGTDTTSATMHWMVLLLANHPDVQKKAHEEIDRVTKGRAITMEDQPELTYTDAVVKECMRLIPVVPMMVPYRASDDVKVNADGKDYVIPANTQVIVNGFNMQRDPALWDEPDRFNPERFLSGPDADLGLRGSDCPNEAHHMKFLPMGTGRRACAGYGLAKVELFLQGATLMQCFDWSPPPGQDQIPIVENFGIALGSSHFDICARYRSEALNVQSAALS